MNDGFSSLVDIYQFCMPIVSMELRLKIFEAKNIPWFSSIT